MPSRKTFVAAMAVSATALLGASPSPPASPSPKPKKNAASDAARALAEEMRRFDSQLTPKQIEAIAGGIDANLRLGKRLNPGGKVLHNWDEPDVPFRVGS